MSLPVVGKAHEAASAKDFHWFIYGSSLSKPAFAQWAEQHGYRVPDFAAAIPARLDGFRLAFDVISKFWGGAVADLTEAPGRSVEGLALPLPGSARGLVDHKEGAISGLYEPLPVKVTPLAGCPALEALAFRAAADRRLLAEVAPAPAFLKILVEGARDAGLSAPYVKALGALGA
jgi:gamma-glutamylcyclotransferase